LWFKRLASRGEEFGVSAPRCLLIGAGRVAGGFVAPLLRDAGWEVILVSRSRRVVEAINEGGGLWVRTGADPPEDRWVGGLSAVSLRDPSLPHLAAGVDLLATAVGPSALPDVGRTLAPLLRARMAASVAPINVITFENHRRAPEVLATSLIEKNPFLARMICRRVGIGGAAVWRTISRRRVTSKGVRFDADDADECYADALALIPGAPPLDDSIPGIELVRAFDDRMIEKLWIFNAGHAAAAYLGWQRGCGTVREAMACPTVRAAVAEVVTEAQLAFEAYLSMRPGSVSIPARPLNRIIDSYADPGLEDPIVRVAREPRRKLAADDRLIGPGVACLAAGFRPLALADTIAAALSYAEPTDTQATDLQREIELLGPEGVLAKLGNLDPQDELVWLVCQGYERRSVATTALLADGPAGRRAPFTLAEHLRRRAQGRGVGSQRRLQTLEDRGLPTAVPRRT
jgi:mannitol-1-phosphate 5-dehydrogenase